MMTERTNTRSVRHKAARTAFFATTACFWLFAVLAALELGARVMVRHEDDTNPLVALRENRPHDPAATASYVESRAKASVEPREPAPCCRWIVADAGGLHLSEAARAATLHPAREALLPRPGQDRRQALELFPRLSEQDRRTFALLHGETVYALDKEGNLLCAYGDYLRRRQRELLFWSRGGLVQRCTTWRGAWRDLRRACRAADGGTPSFVPVPSVSEQGDPVVCSARGNARTGEAAFLFVRSTPSDELKNIPLRPDSPWQIAWFRYKPNLRGVQSAMGYTIDTNSRGFCDTDFAVPKPKGVFRILCLGGSTTEEGESASRTYPKLLEDCLRAAVPGAKVEVLNCGIAGVDTDGQLENLGEFLSFEPDLVVLYEGVNDILKGMRDSWRDWPDHWWRGLLRHSQFMRRFAPLALLPPEETIRHDLRARIITNLETIRSVFAARSVPLAVCTLACPDARALSPVEYGFFDNDTRSHWGKSWISYSFYERTSALFNDELKTWCRDEGLCLIPVDKAYRDGYATFVDLCHMSPAGIERKARAIMSGLFAGEKAPAAR